MLIRKLISCDAGTSLSISCGLLLVFFSCLVLTPSVIAIAETASTNAQPRYIPPELQVSDPNVRALLDSAKESADLGNDGEYLSSLQKALEASVQQKSVGDKAIIEANLGSYYFAQGKLEDARSEWVKSLSDGIAVSNLVLQADVLVALSSLQQGSSHLD
jgi:hypothetical protein